MTDMNHCTQCPNQCPVTDLKCGRGRKCFAQQGIVFEEKENHKHEHGHGKDFFFNQDDLYSLLRTCGHYLYHRYGKNMGQGRILAILSERDRMTQKELQEMLRIQPGSATEILTKLEEKGLILREKDQEDKRRCIIELTEDGREAFNSRKQQEEERSQLFTSLDETEQEELKKLLRKLLESWS